MGVIDTFRINLLQQGLLKNNWRIHRPKAGARRKSQWTSLQQTAVNSSLLLTRVTTWWWRSFLCSLRFASSLTKTEKTLRKRSNKRQLSLHLWPLCFNRKQSRTWWESLKQIFQSFLAMVPVKFSWQTRNKNNSTHLALLKTKTQARMKYFLG